MYTQGKNNTFSNVTFHLNSTHYIQACVRMPYLIMIGPAIWNESDFSVSCHNCSFYTCINRSVPFNHLKDRMYLLKARTGIWIPVRMPRSWQRSPEMYLIDQALSRILKRAKRFVGLLIAVIMGLIAVTATAAVAGAALHQTIQTTEFVQEWHANADRLWTSQRQVDSQLASQMADLQQAVIMLGDQIVSMQKQLRMQCDWNVSSYCVTPLPYNDTHFPWANVKKHLLGQGNLSKEIQHLQNLIFTTFDKKLELLSGSKLLDGLVDGLSSLNPLKYIKLLGGSALVLLGLILILLLLLCVIWRKNKNLSSNCRQQAAVFSLMLHRVARKTKRGR
ncbi:endogenous retrovirus group K member 7 Env polyprotein-like [Carettochelys insculpta]|uniref:endogenous retrovirus group K member 7 Env polyprotein-like n=1 Tax=Carettochelys insculpta TaxID=44489 RepID=UPI003EB9B626